MKILPRRTKIIATLGPAVDNPEKMRAILSAGVNIVRINLSHGNTASHEKSILLAKSCAQALGKIVGILVDLQGPKIRIAGFADPKGILLKKGDIFRLEAMLAPNGGDQSRVGLDYPTLPQEVLVGDQLLLDDGRIVLTVTGLEKTAVECQVLTGGRLLSYKGLNRQGGGLSAASLTEKDKSDIHFIANMPVDYVALSFPRGPEDIILARDLLLAAGSSAALIAKIERAEAIDNIEAIIDAADAVMVARGDLGVEIGYAQLPAVQKQIIRAARTRDKAVITATQMMESMIHNAIPTRAEVSDVANAILDGTDAVMLSAETATGEYPVEVVTILDEICSAAERYREPVSLPEESRVAQHDKAIALSAMYTASLVPIVAIVALTESGSTPRWMSRVRSGIPIYALSRHVDTCQKMTLYRGVFPVLFDVTGFQPWETSRAALDLLVEKGILQQGDKVIVTKGDTLGVGGCTNGLKILTA